MWKKAIVSSISLIALSVFTAMPAYAVNLPDFGSCLNPQGSQIASYENGSHGIVGYSQEVSGSDAVYQSSTNGVTQCFCPLDGNGIQTNWLDTSKLSSSEIEKLKKDGWNYVATGSNWGLKDVPYLAKNSDYACRKNAKKETSTQVLSLASTGDSLTIYTLIISGAAFLISGLILRRFSK